MKRWVHKLSVRAQNCLLAEGLDELTIKEARELMSYKHGIVFRNIDGLGNKSFNEIREVLGLGPIAKYTVGFYNSPKGTRYAKINA